MNELLTVSEVAGILRVDRKTIARWIGIGRLEAVDLSEDGSKYHKYRVKRATLNHLFEGEQHETNTVENERDDSGSC